MHSSTILPLHGGHAPKWLFGRMVKLSAAISNVIIDEFGPDELLMRLCDRNWFQALACAVGYDWHSSGTTTVTLGALKEGLKDSPDIFIAGGKGKAGLKTPEDIIKGCDLFSMTTQIDDFITKSRLAAKVDSSLVYDDAGIYHHSFLFTKNGKWGVVQQAMHAPSHNAIRYQWHCDLVDKRDLTTEPHSAIVSTYNQATLDLTNNQNTWVKESSIGLAKDPRAIEDALMHPNEYPQRHYIKRIDISERGWDAIKRAGELDPRDYQQLMLVKGIGRATLRSLAFISSLIYEKDLAYRDPVAFSYNLGGKDGIPFPVPRKTYDQVIGEMQGIVESANLERQEKYKALRSLATKLN
jgi:uncharacterized protein